MHQAPMGLETHAMFKIEVFNALQTRFGPSKYTTLKTTLQIATQIENEAVTMKSLI
jgi:hypothetical protein